MRRRLLLCFLCLLCLLAACGTPSERAQQTGSATAAQSASGRAPPSHAAPLPPPPRASAVADDPRVAAEEAFAAGRPELLSLVDPGPLPPAHEKWPTVAYEGHAADRAGFVSTYNRTIRDLVGRYRPFADGLTVEADGAYGAQTLSVVITEKSAHATPGVGSRKPLKLTAYEQAKISLLAEAILVQPSPPEPKTPDPSLYWSKTSRGIAVRRGSTSRSASPLSKTCSALERDLFAAVSAAMWERGLLFPD